MLIKKYEKLMRRCLTLAKKGEGQTAPNPMVGAVIFDDNFNIISEGYHEKYGEAHAEVNAVKNAGDIDFSNLSIAVSLEPCSHYGKTPPCADMLIKKGFKRVIVGMQDPNPIVSGNGIKKLKEAGIEVVVGILEDESKELNEIFIKNQIENKPFVMIKTATTLDGKIACKTGDSKWITGEKARKQVQKLRNSYDAIMTGSNTVLKDNPQLNCRLKNGKNPIRVIIDSTLKTPPDSLVYKNDGTKIYLITSDKHTQKEFEKYPTNIEFITCCLKEEKIDLKEAIEKLYTKGIKSIMVEAGRGLNSAIIKENLADKLIQFIAPKVIGDNDAIGFVGGFDVNMLSDAKLLNRLKTKYAKPDIIVEAYFEKH